MTDRNIAREMDIELKKIRDNMERASQQLMEMIKVKRSLRLRK